MDELEKKKEMANRIFSPDSGANQVETEAFQDKLKNVEAKMELRKVNALFYAKLFVFGCFGYDVTDPLMVARPTCERFSSVLTIQTVFT